LVVWQTALTLIFLFDVCKGGINELTVHKAADVTA
jgi:hypothetical protein